MIGQHSAPLDRMKGSLLSQQTGSKTRAPALCAVSTAATAVTDSKLTQANLVCCALSGEPDRTAHQQGTSSQPKFCNHKLLQLDSARPPATLPYI
jgi:hypothetical protein